MTVFEVCETYTHDAAVIYQLRDSKQQTNKKPSENGLHFNKLFQVSRQAKMSV